MIENKKCIHCLIVPDKITFDHVIPRSWYSIKSNGVIKLKAPSCYECNNKLGEEEKVISHLMWICMPETHPLRSELTEKVYRACGLSLDGKPLLGISDNERHIRKLYAKKLLSLTTPSDNISDENLLPGFSFHSGYPRETQRAVRIPANSTLNIARKVIRGLEYTYLKSERYIEKPYKLEVYFPKDSHAPALDLIRQKSLLFQDKTNTIHRAINPSNPLEPIYIIKLWDLWEIWGVITLE